MTSRDCRRTRLGARRRLARTPAMVPVSARDGRSGAIVQACSGRGTDADGSLLDRVVVGEPEVPHLSKVLGGEPRVHRCVETVLGQIPTAATRHPRRLGEPLLDALVVAVLDVFAYVQVTQVVVQDGGDTAHDVVELTFDVNQQRIVAGPGVGTGHEEQVRIPVCAGTLVSLCATGPFGAQHASTKPGDREGRTGQMHVVPGGEDDASQMVFDTVAGADPDRAQCRDRPVDELAIVALQGGVVVTGNQHAFAARSV